MLRPAFAACLGAAFGALSIGTARERFADMLVQPIEACSVGLVSAAAFVLAVLVLACREPAYGAAVTRCRPRLGGGWQPCCGGAERPVLLTVGSGVNPARASGANAKAAPGSGI